MRLYLAEAVNGVAALLTEGAHGAYEQADSNNTSLLCDMDPLLRLNITQGTMTFVDVVGGNAECDHTGPLEMLKVISMFCEVLPSTVAVYVPFTSPQNTIHDKSMGFGPCIEIVQFIIKRAPKRPNPAYNATRAMIASMTV